MFLGSKAAFTSHALQFYSSVKLTTVVIALPFVSDSCNPGCILKILIYVCYSCCLDNIIFLLLFKTLASDKECSNIMQSCFKLESFQQQQQQQ